MYQIKSMSDYMGMLSMLYEWRNNYIHNAHVSVYEEATL